METVGGLRKKPHKQATVRQLPEGKGSRDGGAGDGDGMRLALRW